MPRPLTGRPPGRQPYRDRTARADPEPGDEIAGTWPRERIIEMDAAYVSAVERAIAAGKERRPEQGRERAA